MSIIRRIEDYLEYPDKFNMLKFCVDYKELSEILWGFVDENDLKIIEESLNQVMVKALIGQVPKRFEGLSKEQIKSYFDQRKIELLDEVPESSLIRIKKRLNDLLIKNLSYVKRLEMKAPIKGNLENEEYYNNYLIVESVIPSLQYAVDSRKNKKGGK
ncbi:MAG TPA: hypothetical protein GX713_00860 [Mollicutes bacterium]|nr:hypothetical protein [Mollicutes bacterium]